MKEVLVVTYHYPPRATVGGLRPYGLAKYLLQFGWQARILTCSDFSPSPLARKLGLNQNQNLLGQMQDLQKKYPFLPIKFLATRYAEIFYYPDPMKGWKKIAIQKGIETIHAFKIKAIISTSSPATAHLVACQLSRTYDIPWIADFRDLWTQNHYYPYSNVRREIEKRLEIKTMKQPTALVTVSEPLSDKLSQLHGREVITILNGYDPQEVNPGVPLTKARTLTYTGSIYPDKQDTSCVTQGNNHFDEIRFYGPKQKCLDGLAKVYQYGPVPRAESLQRQRESHALLYLAWKGEEGIYSAKLFEYVAAKRPIIVSGKPDRYISKVLEDAAKGDIEKYSQIEMARKFAEVLDKL